MKFRVLAGALFVLGLARPASAAAVCYRLPFSNPDLADGWGSTCCGRTSPHRGVDFPQASGTPIPAVADGVIRRVPYSSCLGNVVVVQHADGMYSGYSHMLSGSPLGEGTTVTKGQTIGQVGNTGSCSYGSHLHLTMAPSLEGYASGTTVDPYAYITSHTTCNSTPRGAFDAAYCDGLSGWAQDPDSPGSAIDVHLYIGGPAGDPKAYGMSIKANLNRSDLCTAIGSCNHGFSVPPPLGFFDGVAREVYAYAIDSGGGGNPLLGTKTLKCAPPRLPVGRVRRYVPSPAVLAAWKISGAEIAKVADAEIDVVPLGPDLSASPQLVQIAGAPEVYVREYETLRHVTSPAVMDTWELNWGAIKTLPAADLAKDLRGATWTSMPFLVQRSDGKVYLLDSPPPLWAELVDETVPEEIAPGMIVEATFKLRNRGSMTWSSVMLAPTPRDVASPLCDSSWPSCTRATAVPKGVKPNDETSVTFAIHAPANEGTLKACFGLLTGTHWFSDPGQNGPADDVL